jgi:hypothetical protein
MSADSCPGWWHRLSHVVQDWLLRHPAAPLPDHVVGAVRWAGGPLAPVRSGRDRGSLTFPPAVRTWLALMSAR